MKTELPAAWPNRQSAASRDLDLDGDVVRRISTKPGIKLSELESYWPAAAALLAFPPIFLAGSFPQLELFHDVEGYASAHTIMESFSLAVCALIFGSGWYTASGDRSGVMAFLSTSFLAVGLLDLGHLLSFGGMPAFVTPAGGDKALAFWIAARYVGAVALLAIALSPLRWKTSATQTYAFLGTALALVALAYWLILFRSAALPHLFVEGHGLTPLKIWAEYGVVALHVLTLAILAVRGQRNTPFSVTLLLAGVIVLAASEVAFTKYRAGYDNYNVVGHIYKVIAFALIYRVVFVEAVSEPFRLRAESEALLRLSQEHLARAQRIGHIGSVEHDFDIGTLSWSDELYAILGLDPGITRPSIERFFERVHVDDRARARQLFDRDLAGEGSAPNEIRIQRPGGEIRWTLRRSELVRAEDGRNRRLTVTLEDFTERKQVVDALEESEQLLREATAAANIGVYVHDHRTNQIQWSPEQRRNYGVGQDETVTLERFLSFVHPDDRPRIAGAVQRAHDPAGDGRFDVVHRIVRRDGAVRWLSTHGYTAFEGQGAERRPARTTGAVFDISDRMAIEERLRRSEAHLGQAQSVGRIGSSEVDIARDEHRWSDEYYRLLGLDPATTRPSLEAILSVVLPEDLAKFRPIATLAGIEDPIPPLELRVVRGDGEIRWLLRHAARIVDAAGTPISLMFTLQDITEFKLAEERRLALERQLAQSQKMETVGQLTGGVAHDFNNLLGVILGRLQLLEDELVADPTLREWVQICIRAAERGASLTRSLLAFSRLQPLKPSVIELNAIVGDMVELLRRTLGETIEIELATARQLWSCMADPGQVQNALLNLAVNARDAMPDGGRLTIETANARLDAAHPLRDGDVEPGDYVALSVSDTGVGMSPETVQRAFEPFFTTKRDGEGSGLGLSMVYGFARQSGGHVSLSSELGRGATVRLYLPRAQGPAMPAPLVEPAIAAPRGSGTILVVEDNQDLRDITREQLERLGYRVFAARDAADGLKALDEHPEIAVLVCDIVLGGGLSGPEFAELALEQCPNIAVIFMTGYSGQAAAAMTGRFGSASILQKPFAAAELARRVRAALDFGAPPAPPGAAR
jgi:PAS domain S-box-containing protein